MSKHSTSIHLVSGSRQDDSAILESVGSTNQLSQSTGDSLRSGSSIRYNDDFDDTSSSRYAQQLASSDSVPGASKHYRVYPRRWGILAQFCGLILANATLWVTFAPISNAAEDYFGSAGTTTRVNMLAVVFLILYPVGTALEVYCMQWYKLRTTLLVGGLLTLCGSLLRVIGVVMKDYGVSDIAVYIFVLFGQMLAALAQPLFMNCPASISAAWFPPSERDISTSCGSLFSPLGNAVGSVFPILFVSYEQSSDQMNRGMVGLMLTEFALCVVPLAVAYVYFEEAPPTAPSYSTLLKHANTSKLGNTGTSGGNRIRLGTNMTASTVGDSSNPGSANNIDDLQASLSLISGGDAGSNGNDKDMIVELSSRHSEQDWSSTYAQLRILRRNKNYVILFVGFVLGLGLFTGLLTFINQIVLPYGYSNDDAGTFSAVLLFSGLLGAAVVSQILEKTKAYETVLKSGFALCFVALAFMISQLKPDNFSVLCGSFAVLGVALLPMLPATIENAAECTYPTVTEDLSVGLLFMGGNVMGIAITSVLEYLLKQELDTYGTFSESGQPSSTGYSPNDNTGTHAFKRPSNIFMLSILACSIVVLMVYKGEYNRLKAETLGHMPSSSRAPSGNRAEETYRPPLLDSAATRGTAGSYETAHSTPGIHKVGGGSVGDMSRDSNTTTNTNTTMRTSSVAREGGDVLGGLPTAGDFRANSHTPHSTTTSFQWGASDLGTLSQRETITVSTPEALMGAGGNGQRNYGGGGGGANRGGGRGASQVGTLRNVLNNGR